MSVQQVEALLRAAGDGAGFAAQLAQAPSILTGYDLSEEERSALLEHDGERLRAMGVDEKLIGAVGLIGQPDAREETGSR
jgi:hypothetical protein